MISEQGSGDGLVPSGNKSLPKPVLMTMIPNVMWRL